MRRFLGGMTTLGLWTPTAVSSKCRQRSAADHLHGKHLITLQVCKAVSSRPRDGGLRSGSTSNMQLNQFGRRFPGELIGTRVDRAESSRRADTIGGTPEVRSGRYQFQKDIFWPALGKGTPYDFRRSTIENQTARS